MNDWGANVQTGAIRVEEAAIIGVEAVAGCEIENGICWFVPLNGTAFRVPVVP